MLFQFVLFGLFSLAFWYCSEMLAKKRCSFMEVMAAQLGIMFSGFQAGQDASLFPNKGTALESMCHAYRLLTDTQDEKENANLGRNILISHGAIEFQNVSFTYPTRPDAEVLKGLSFKVKAGETVAIVGASGCGKSTTMALLQKLYHPTAGTILLDGMDVRTINKDHLRSQLAVVTQEPKLFDMSIADNIAYRPNEFPQAERTRHIHSAGMSAHTDEFACLFPEKYEYKVGRFGSRLSGGQRQRVAIAQALFGHSKDRKILLLDEATSALDNESEVLVQKALAAAQTGRTTIIVAHRLGTIQDADNILVLENGRLVEQGTFDQLSKSKGVFWSLYESQL
jgi:ABC-type multidrug transport system fused ATPase/permease subunit